MCKAAVLLAVFLAPLLAQPDRFGLPACSASQQELLIRSAFITCYDGSLKAPVWAVHELTPARPSVRVTRRHFRRDWSLTVPSASDSDYRNSGYSRGHAVPAADVSFSEQALRDSFLLSNVIAQPASLNLGLWRRLENRIRKLADNADSVIVITGAIFPEVPERIGAGRVAVPSELYKVVLVRLADGQISLSAVIIPNVDNPGAPLHSFTVPPADVEKRTGVEFFPNPLDKRTPGALVQREPENIRLSHQPLTR